MKTVDLLIKSGFVVTVDSHKRVYTNGYVAVQDGRIVGCGPQDECAFQGKREIDAKDKIVMPGLVNAHSHLVQIFLRGLGEAMPLFERLAHLYYPITGAAHRERAYLGVRLMLLELLKSGVTTTHDDHFVYRYNDSIDGVCEAIRDSGIRAVVSRSIANNSVAVPAGYRERVADGLREVDRVYNLWQSDRIRIITGPLGLGYVESADDLRTIKAFAKERGMLFYGHFPSNRARSFLKKEGWDGSPWAYLDHLRLLDENTLAAVGSNIPTDPKDLELIKARGTRICLEPALPWIMGRPYNSRRLLAYGIPVGMGLDGCPITPNQDMWAAMRYMVTTQRHFDLTAGAGGWDIADAWGSPATVLEVATIGGARALGLEHEIGSLEPGKWADLILIDANHVRLNPRAELLNNLLWTGSPDMVSTVIVQGEVVVENGRHTRWDEEEVVRQANEVQRVILRETGTERYLSQVRVWAFI